MKNERALHLITSELPMWRAAPGNRNVTLLIGGKDCRLLWAFLPSSTCTCLCDVCQAWPPLLLLCSRIMSILSWLMQCGLQYYTLLLIKRGLGFQTPGPRTTSGPQLENSNDLILVWMIFYLFIFKCFVIPKLHCCIKLYLLCEISVAAVALNSFES